MAIERNPDGLFVDEFVDSLVKWKVMSPEKMVDKMHIRYLPGTVKFPSIDSPHLDYPVRITEGKRQRRTVEINNHSGDGGIDICCNTVLKAEHNTGIRITIITKFVISEQQTRADSVGDLCPAVRDRYQEGVAFFHQYQYLFICRKILLTFGLTCCRYRSLEMYMC
jgi:hypothetical protein